MITIHDSLKLPPDTPLRLTGLRSALWGQDLIFSGIAGEKQTFELALLDCRELRWQGYAHMQAEGRPAFPAAQIVDLHLGRDQHRSPMRLLTDYFGLIVSYGEIRISSTQY
jgi:hypothetical protein